MASRAKTVVVFGLAMSSSWGNGHATQWRGIARALGRKGHRLVFFERDVPYYAKHRDLHSLEGGGELVLYQDFADLLPRARRELAKADAALVTSYCPDGVAASELVLSTQGPARVFYDLDTPVTLEQRAAGHTVEYLPPQGLGDFDLVLSFTGGAALEALKTQLHARTVAPLYGCVDPQLHHPVPARSELKGDLSYLGTWAANRQQQVDTFLLQPARRLPRQKFVIGGSMYPADFPWRENVFYVPHVPPPDHPAFYCSSRLTLSVTRAPMAAMGYCPSARLFEAAACKVPVVSDVWDGLATFFEPGREILFARSADDVVEALSRPPAELARIGEAAYRRAMADHAADRRADELLALIAGVPGKGA